MNFFLRTILGPASFPQKRKQTPTELLEVMQEEVVQTSTVRPAQTSPLVNKEPDNGIRE